MNVILRTYSTSPDSSGGCDYAEISLDGKLARAIRRRMALLGTLQKIESSLCCLEFWENTPKFFSYCEELDEIANTGQLERGVLATDRELEHVSHSDYIHTECERMVVMPDLVYWKCRPKHSEYMTIETAAIPGGSIKEVNERPILRRGGS